jgi:hypothetical protein
MHSSRKLHFEQATLSAAAMGVAGDALEWRVVTFMMFVKFSGLVGARN